MAMWLCQLALVISACALCGWFAEQVGQCRVVGEIVAGIVLGPSVIGALSPSFYSLMFSPAASAGMAQLGEVGVVFLMFEIGLHLDLGTQRGVGALKAPLAVAAGGMVLPFAVGLIAFYLSHALLAPEIPLLRYVLFGGVALSVSAVPVMARIVKDMRITQYPAVKLALSAAMLTDLAGWLMLAVIASVAAADGSPSTLWRTVIGLSAFVIVSIVAMRVAVRPFAERAVRARSMGKLIAVVVPYLLVSAWATADLGLHSAFGALFAAVLLRNMPGLKQQWDKHFDGFVRVVLLPVFFAYAGLHVSISSLDGLTSWLWFAIFLCIAFVCKFGGSYLGARFSGMNRQDSAVVGSLMNTRGLMELIVLSIGLQMHALSPGVYAILVFVALVTTSMTVPFIRRWGGMEVTAGERQAAAERT